jgi:AcrR family transcriptional regulator
MSPGSPAPPAGRRAPGPQQGAGTPQAGRGPRPEKRAAITRAARAVFARLGYTRASTELIAGEAGVSTRTLYNHFATKDELFRSVLIEGATEVADAFVGSVATLPPGGDLDPTIIMIGEALAAHRLDFPEHFAMSQQVATERDRFPIGLLDEWRRVGPGRVEHEVARLLTELAAGSRLTLENPDQAVAHLILLTAGAIAFRAPPGTPIPRAEARAIVCAGVHTFLYGHLTPAV